MGKPLQPSEYDLLANAKGWSRWTIELEQNTKLNGLIRKPQNRESTWILFFPGNDANQLRTGKLFLEELRQRNDWGLAVFAYRGYDGSTGTFDYRAHVEDAQKITAMLCKQELIKESQVQLVGFSIGGHFAAIASKYLNIRGTPARSLTLISSVNDIEMVQNSRFSRFLKRDHYLTAPVLELVPKPILVLQGTADEAFGGTEQGRAIAQSLGGRATYREIDGAGHNEILANQTALELVRQFVTQNIDR